ncbi:hypothetical protein [Comamonas thiooxydans]|uniref:hypothetical protein n=1 Tax=Comamonas thiooxydans TaxID=363952 RepID=UPI00311F9A37
MSNLYIDGFFGDERNSRSKTLMVPSLAGWSMIGLVERRCIGPFHLELLALLEPEACSS